MRTGYRVLAIFMVLFGDGCGVLELALPRPFHLSRAHVDARSAHEAGPSTAPGELAWATEIPRAIMVDRDSRSLVLYERGRPVEVFNAVFGRVVGRKRHEGDMKTPSGIYRVIRKREHWKFHKFLDIDYPNEEDLHRYRAAAKKGGVPKMPSGRTAGPGRLIGIHGSSHERLNELDVDWTLGCVSLLNDDVDRLYERVEEGTLVVIGHPPLRAPKSDVLPVVLPSEEAADPRIEAARGQGNPTSARAPAEPARGGRHPRADTPAGSSDPDDLGEAD